VATQHTHTHKTPHPLAPCSYPYPSSYIVNGAQPPLPAFPVRAACEHLAQPGLEGQALLQGLAAAVGVFYNHTNDLDCFSFKQQGPDPETGGAAAGLSWA
jgi:lysosomal Pro-X carboxypeptidase